MKKWRETRQKQKRGDKSNRINVLDYLTGTFFIVLIALIIYGMIDYILNL